MAKSLIFLVSTVVGDKGHRGKCTTKNRSRRLACFGMRRLEKVFRKTVHFCSPPNPSGSDELLTDASKYQLARQTASDDEADAGLASCIFVFSVRR